eukprot:g7068.t1
MFGKVVTALLLAASLLTPAGAWGFPPAVKSPRGFATSDTVTSAVTSIIGSVDSTPTSEAGINQLVAQAAKDVDVVKAAVSAVSAGGAPPTFEASVLSSIIQARDSWCPIQEDKNTAGPTDCVATYDTCMASCSQAGLFGRGAIPESGTCTFVCTVLQQGCTRCHTKRKLNAAEVAGRWSILLAKAQIWTQTIREDVRHKLRRAHDLLWAPVIIERPLVMHIIRAALFFTLTISGWVWEARRIARYPARLFEHIERACFERRLTTSMAGTSVVCKKNPTVDNEAKQAMEKAVEKERVTLSGDAMEEIETAVGQRSTTMDRGANKPGAVMWPKSAATVHRVTMEEVETAMYSATKWGGGTMMAREPTMDTSDGG